MHAYFEILDNGLIQRQSRACSLMWMFFSPQALAFVVAIIGLSTGAPTNHPTLSVNTDSWSENYSPTNTRSVRLQTYYLLFLQIAADGKVNGSSNSSSSYGTERSLLSAGFTYICILFLSSPVFSLLSSILPSSLLHCVYSSR